MPLVKIDESVLVIMFQQHFITYTTTLHRVFNLCKPILVFLQLTITL